MSHELPATDQTAVNQAAVSVPEETGSRRMRWADVPDLAARIADLLRQDVVGAADQPGGFSEGVAARLRLSDGSGVFIKAANPVTAPAEANHHRREIAVSRSLPPEAPVPGLISSSDDQHWVALVFEEIPGRLATQPWRRDELERVLATVTDLARIMSPAPVSGALLGQPRLGGWTGLASGAAKDRLRALSPWAASHLDELLALEEHAATDGAGETLLHGDLYPFNIMLTAERVFVIDWPHAWIGAPHCDLVTLLAGVSLSGIDPQPIAEAHPLTRDLHPRQINTMLALHSGFLLRSAISFEGSADPHLINMMLALGRSSVRWLTNRLATGP